MTCFFFHIPKTAGTSFKRVLEQWYNSARDVEFKDLDAAAQVLSSATGRDEWCVHGHFSGRLHNKPGSLLTRYPWVRGNPDAKVITMLRDPVEHAISYYYHLRREKRTPLKLLEFLSSEHKVSQSSALGVRHEDQIDQMLSSFAFIGVSDRLQDSINQCAAALGKRSATASHERIGTRDGQISAIGADEIAEIERIFELDRKIYDRVKSNVVKNVQPVRRPEIQFEYLFESDKLIATSAGRRSDAISTHEVDGEALAARLTKVEAVDERGAPSTEFVCNACVRIVIEFVVETGEINVEPALRVFREGATAFVVAYTPDARPTNTFGPGRHRVEAIIPANILNTGRYDIEASLNVVDVPVKRLDVSNPTLAIRIHDGALGERTAKGSYEFEFPGVVRPLVDWVDCAS